MGNEYTFIADITRSAEIPDDGILSRPIINTDALRVVLFAFSAGQELSEHTASMPALIHVIRGNARITLGGDEHAAGEGTWVHMPPNLPHSIRAESPLILVLVLAKPHGA